MARGRRKGWHERKRKENVGERERKDSVRPGAWVEARARTTADSAGMNGTGGGGYRNRNQGAQEHEQTRRRRWRRRRPRYGGSVAFAGSRQGNEMPPSRGGRPSSSTPGSFYPAVTLPPEPTFLARISRVLLFSGNVAGMAETAAATGEERRGEIASNFASSTGKRGKGLGRRSLALIPRDTEIRTLRACDEKIMLFYFAKLITYLMIPTYHLLTCERKTSDNYCQ